MQEWYFFTVHLLGSEQTKLLEADMLGNIIFHLKSAKKWDEKLFWYQFISVVPHMTFTYLSVLLPSYIVSMLQKNTDVGRLLVWISLIVIGMALCNVVSSGMEQYLYRNSMNLTLFYEEQIFRKMTRVSYQELEKEETHTLLGNIWTGFRNEYMIRNSVTGFSGLLEAVLASALYGYFVLRIHWILFSIILAAILMNFLFLKKSRKRQGLIHQKIGEPMKMAAYVKRHSMERAEGKDIRIYQMQEWFIRKYDDAIRKMSDLYGKIHRVYFIRQLGELGIQGITEFLAYGYMTLALTRNLVTISEFVFSVGVIRTFSGYFSGLINRIQEQNGIQTFLTNIRKMLSYQEEKKPTKETIAIDTENGLEIEFRNVSFRYENAKEDILTDINLKIHSGEKLALIGLNGAGKTTMVKLICGFYEPTAGEILVNGRPKRCYSQDEYLSKISALFQDSFLFPLSLDENLTGSSEVAEGDEQVKAALSYSGFAPIYERCRDRGKTMLVREVNADATDFSGGEKQKLLFARALYKQSKLLILDEPTAALDPIAENELYQNFGKAAGNNTVIFISHRLSSTRFCDRIILLEGARILEEGSHEQLMNQKGRYAELFEVQSKYYRKTESELNQEEGCVHE